MILNLDLPLNQNILEIPSDFLKYFSVEESSQAKEPQEKTSLVIRKSVIQKHSSLDKHIDSSNKAGQVSEVKVKGRMEKFKE